MMTLGDLLFVTNDDTMVSVIDNETCETVIKPITCDEMELYGGGFADCIVMDVCVENNVMNVYIEV